MMRATPLVSRWGDDAGKLNFMSIVSDQSDGGLWIMCEVFEPPSSKGRQVQVFFPASIIDDTLRGFRDKARDNRLRSGPQDDAVSPLCKKSPFDEFFDWIKENQ